MRDPRLPAVADGLEHGHSDVARRDLDCIHHLLDLLPHDDRLDLDHQQS
jgi:hypothetical protein